MNASKFHPDRSLTTVTESIIVRAAFILLFPGFFFYQTLIGLGAIGASLGGYFAAMALLLTGPLGYVYLRAIKKHRDFFSRFDVYIVIFLLYYALVIFLNYAAGANKNIAQKYFFSLLYLVDVYIIFRMIDLDDKRFIALATLSLVFMSGITVHFSIDGFFYLQALGEAQSPESLATYQGFARSYIYTFLILIASGPSISLRLILYAVATVSLFLNGARSEFSAVLFSIPIIEFYYSKCKLCLLIPLMLILILFVANIQSLVDMLPNNRTVQLFDLSQSSSVAARQQLSSNAWRTIVENPVFGDFASYPDGNYAHNILCAWVDFGLLGFMLFAGLLLWPACRLFADGYFLETKSSDFILACAFVCITILWVLTAKAVPDMSVGAALGAYAKYRYGKDMARIAHRKTARLRTGLSLQVKSNALLFKQ